MEDPGLSRFISKAARGGGSDNYDSAIVSLKSCSPQAREDLLHRLRSLSRRPPVGRQLMNWKEAEEMQSGGLIRFEAHTSSHTILDQVPLQQAEEEIVRSRIELEQGLGAAPEFFAYPNGNFNGDLQAILRRHGFRGAFTTRKGLVGRGVSLYEIPRIGIHEDVSRTLPLFMGRILLKGF
jgi:peptidoglycan/xylan/chitin deacetylase (PgdA/CDA1 family)